MTIVLMRQRVLGPILLAVPLALAVLNASCNSESSSQANAHMPTTTENVATLAKELSVWLPSGTTIIGVERHRGMDDIIQAKLTMSPDLTRQFLQQLPIKPDAFEPNAGATMSGGAPWWDPPSSLRVGQTMLEGARALHVGIDDRDAKTIVVYIANHGT